MSQEQNNIEATRLSVRLFLTFFRIGAFTLGGGYAMIPIIEEDIVNKRRWITHEDFLDLIAVAQSCPGVFAVNISTFIGYKLSGTRGALLASLGAALPSFLIILSIALFFQHFQDIQWVASCFNGIRPAVVALIAAPTFTLARSARISLSNCWIPIASALLIWQLGVNPIYIIIAAGIGGYVYGNMEK
ncbi:MAG: chromate transporter [Prevotella sp.]